MIRARRFKRIFPAVLLSLLLTACGGDLPRTIYQTDSSRGQTYPPFTLPEPEQSPPPSAFPVAGIVSHHLLAGAYIDDWFRQLKQMREVETFIILSPRHWDLGSERISVVNGRWLTADGAVNSSEKLTRRLLKTWNVQQDPEAFAYEHGVGTLIAFIEKYFPEADIVAVALPGEPPMDQPLAAELRDGILPLLQRDKNAFLIISSDFSHHAGPETTAKRDEQSRRFLSAPGPDTWIFAGCDNRPGMYVLGALAGELDNPHMTILYHTDAYTISGEARDDITSYFFTFLMDDAP